MKLILMPPGQTIGSDPAIVFRTDPRDVFRQALVQVLATLVAASLDAGQIPEAVRIARLYPGGQSDMHNGEGSQLTDIFEEWGSIPEAELPAASMLAVQYGLENRGDTAAMVNQALALIRRYPRSCYAPTALSRAIRKLRGAPETTQTDRLKALLARQYPASVQAHCIEIEAAFNRGDLAQARRLVANYEAKSRGAAGLESDAEDPVGLEWIESRLMRYDQLVQQLKPLLDAAHDPDLARMDRLETNGEALAEALSKRLPDRAAEIYLTLSQVYQNPALTMRFLERFPSHPQAGEAWQRLIGDDGRVTPGALNRGDPETVEWLAPFINRNDAHSAAAATLLKKQIANSYAGSRMAEEEARIVQSRYPQSRAACVANLAAAKVLLASHRPEAMLAYADRAIAGLPQTDPDHLEAAQLRQRAVQEIAAKHR